MIEEFNDILLMKFMHENSFCKIEHQILPWKEGKEILIALLSKFHGFDGKGYFHLGRPLLASIMGNFTTYLIVFLQFKMAEL